MSGGNNNNHYLSFECAGIGHQVISKGSLALAVSLPSINNFHSDAELEELRPSEEEISGLRR